MKESFEKLTLRKICKDSNIALGTFYNYFENKEHFVSEIFLNDWEKINKMVLIINEENISLKEKCRKLYISLENFLNDYHSVFYEIAASRKNVYSCVYKDKFKSLYDGVAKWIEKEDSSKKISSNLSYQEISQLLVSNFLNIIKNPFISFDQLYDNFLI